MTDFGDRLRRLQEAMRRESAVAALFAPSDQMRYLTGWAESGHERLIGLFVPSEGEPAFLVPTMNVSQARGNPAGITGILGWDDATGWQPMAKSLLRGWKVDRARDAFVLIDDELQSGHLLSLQRLFPNVWYRTAGQVMAGLREVKTEEELRAMTEAGALIDTVYEEIVGALQDGITERDLQERVLLSIRRHGSRPSFTPLICFGPHTAVPHHVPDASVLRSGDIVVIDIGCVFEGYASDITRTVAFGTPADPDAAAVYDTVFRAHAAGCQAVGPGVTGEAVDDAARQVVTQAGYGPQFIHRTGHGIGLSTHEPPYIVHGNTAPLKPGMCFSIEPGIYLPGRFGVRVENIYTVTEQGALSLNCAPAPALPIL